MSAFTAQGSTKVCWYLHLLQLRLPNTSMRMSAVISQKKLH